ncbi:hypothetical protein CRE_12688 [Caenorhabditis remanei]|uniref:Uncharacterized protein n=1 Tax=Caenorhabditis remanei TaxID=31234 RepID=E3M7A5_CAERE|nr:hypothetical protein CRE_12688 [Caenorhabditis remanei]
MFYDIFTSGHVISPYYYNCTGTSSLTESKVAIGLIYMTIGLISQFVYFLVLYTIFNSKTLFSLPCYKIMFFLGIPDIFSLIFCADFAGFYSIRGLHPCYSINFTFTTGCLVFGSWHMSCLYVLLLAFNRVCELIFPEKCAFLFQKWYLQVLLFLPVPYFFYFAFFTKPTFFNSSVSAFLLNPMTDVTKNFPSEYYTVEAYVFNNFFVMVFIGFCYLIICSYLLKKSWKIQMKQTSALVKRVSYHWNYILTNLIFQVTYQCLTVCTCHFIGCFLYVYIQYFWVPEFLSVVCHLAWIGNHSELNNQTSMQMHMSPFRSPSLYLYYFQPIYSFIYSKIVY